MEKYKGISVGDKCRLIKPVKDYYLGVPIGTEFVVEEIVPASVGVNETYFFYGHSGMYAIRAWRNEIKKA